MSNRVRFWMAFFMLTALCWVDYQYFTEGDHVNNISERYRQVMHLVILMAIVPIGYFGWMKHPLGWMKKLWLLPYLLVILFIGCIGAIQWEWAPFNIQQLDIVSMIRLFFCSPMPYLILYLFSLLAEKGSLLADRQA